MNSGKKISKKISDRPLTTKQKRVIELVIADDSGTKKEIMQKAGYGSGNQKAPSRVFESKPVKKALQKHEALFEDLILDAQARAKETVKDAKYRDVIDTIDKSKKHLNIIHGVDNGDTSKIIVIPGEIVNRFDDKVIDGEIEEIKAIKK